MNQNSDSTSAPTHPLEGVGLVMEGGGMRCIYSCGVLEHFLEQDFHPPYLIGVSAGASNSASYIAKQKGRNKRLNTLYINDPRYMGLKSWITKGEYFGLDFLFDTLPNELDPMDYDTYESSRTIYKAVTTDCETGRPVYFDKKDFGPNFEVLRASVSLPLLSPMVNYKGYRLLDGGISDPIPVRKALDDGNKKLIIVLTRNAGYKKKPLRFKGLFKILYGKYPELVEALEARSRRYNDSLELIEELEAEGRAFVIRPTVPLEVDRLERNVTRLEALFDQGQSDAQARFDELLSFCQSK